MSKRISHGPKRIESDKRISELLIETGAYKDLEKPVILTSGELGIYYINTEKLCQDNGKFNDYGDDSWAMINHAISMTKEHPKFKEVINILSEEVRGLLSQANPACNYAVSGGQRRDWLFSGPVAKNLDVDHISLYKDGKMEVINPKGKIISPDLELENYHVVHVVDLLTEGSSAYRKEEGKEKGWIPMIRKGGGAIRDLVAVVTRLQGGEERLEEQEVNVTAKIAINDNFLKQRSNNPKRALSYAADPKKWSENYLKENGALNLLNTFDPNGGKMDRAKKFLIRYGGFLKEYGKFKELEDAVQNTYKISLVDIVK